MLLIGVCYVTHVIDLTGESDGEAVVGAAFSTTRSVASAGI